MEFSTAKSLNKEDLKSIARNALIMFTPVILILLDQIQKGDVDYKIVTGMAIAIVFDAIRRYLRGVTK